VTGWFGLTPASVLASGAPGTARLLQEGAGLCRLLRVAQTIGLSAGSPSPADIEPSSWPARVAGGWRGASRCLALASGAHFIENVSDGESATPTPNCARLLSTP